MGQSCQHIDAAQSVAASVAQIELAVREVRPAVEKLGLLIDAMATGLGQLRRAGPQGPAAEGAGPLIQELEKNVYGSITQLQFYDRLVQHLSHIQDFLSGVAGNLANDLEGDPNNLESLRARLRARLISEAQRELLDAVLPPPEGVRSSSQVVREESTAQGTVELF